MIIIRLNLITTGPYSLIPKLGKVFSYTKARFNSSSNRGPETTPECSPIPVWLILPLTGGDGATSDEADIQQVQSIYV